MKLDIMSTLVIEVCKIDKIEPHADKLEFTVVKGWRTAVRKGEFKLGQKCVCAIGEKK